MLNSINSTFQASSNSMLNISNNLSSSIINKFQTMNSQVQSCFNNMRINSINAMNDVYSNVDRQLRNIKSLFSNFNATLKVKIPHFYMTGKFNAETREVPKVGVNYFARGGVVDRATLGVLEKQEKKP